MFNFVYHLSVLFAALPVYLLQLVVWWFYASDASNTAKRDSQLIHWLAYTVPAAYWRIADKQDAVH